MESKIRKVRRMLMEMGLNEYQASALAYLIYLGEAKATTLSRACGVPSSRIYDVLDELAKKGLVVVKPGRPVRYSARSPEDIASALVSEGIRELRERLAGLQARAKEFSKLAQEIYKAGSVRMETTPLLRIVSVGSTSLEETRRLYESASQEILIISKAFEYFPEVSDALKGAVERGVKVKLILMDPFLLPGESRVKQAEILKALREQLGDGVEIRFFNEHLPLRGCIVDPGGDGKALFLVEEPGIPLFLREAAITTHYNLVNGLALLFKLLWEKARSAHA
ncbi:MAG: TrmB family transcriptional regulator [Thermoprotei archaeon]|nr:MAG: TrmB family transcriptional regulator [Thermoprotei archaeon]